jgi:hypothetical protein
MGEWRKDQSKHSRRNIWGETRGQSDETWQDFAQRVKAFPWLAKLRFEKIGGEIHLWQQVPDTKRLGETYWMSVMRFVDDGWGYWDVLYRTDEGRWRPTDIKKLPIGRAVTLAAEFYQDRMAR